MSSTWSNMPWWGWFSGSLRSPSAVRSRRCAGGHRLGAGVGFIVYFSSNQACMLALTSICRSRGLTSTGFNSGLPERRVPAIKHSWGALPGEREIYFCMFLVPLAGLSVFVILRSTIFNKANRRDRILATALSCAIFRCCHCSSNVGAPFVLSAHCA